MDIYQLKNGEFYDQETGKIMSQQELFEYRTLYKIWIDYAKKNQEEKLMARRIKRKEQKEAREAKKIQ